MLLCVSGGGKQDGRIVAVFDAVAAFDVAFISRKANEATTRTTALCLLNKL